ncbi:Csa1 family protein [Staphylococcus aureus]|uniref:Csa1 family protein n=1 Tax=Staphylococcus aureus TaxID=1280 RepID=UPI0004BC854B
MTNFKDINDYKDGDISYNPNVPSYSAKYQLKNDDYNVKQLRKRYNIPEKKLKTLSFLYNTVTLKILMIIKLEKLDQNLMFQVIPQNIN